ncbi:hypothetical protein T484DRAFT_2025682 [Baffinella frigidus]|nr:hypothetical protein T484DRAFT_2025682 [Cryptophyta sp. CCMP2293]
MGSRWRQLSLAAIATLLVAVALLHGQRQTVLEAREANPNVGVLANQLQSDELSLANFVQSQAKQATGRKKRAAASLATASRRRPASGLEQQDHALDFLQNQADGQLSSARARLTREQQEGLAIKDVMAHARSQLRLARAEKRASVAAKEASVLDQENNNRQGEEQPVEARAAAAARFYNAKRLLELKRQQQAASAHAASAAAARVPYSDDKPQLTAEERAFISRSVSSPLPPTRLARAAAKPARRAKLSGGGSWPGEREEKEEEKEEEEEEEEEAPEVNEPVEEESGPVEERNEPAEATPTNVQAFYGEGVHGSSPLALPGTEHMGAAPPVEARVTAPGRVAAALRASPPRARKQAAASGGVWPGESAAPAPEEREEAPEEAPEEERAPSPEAEREEEAGAGGSTGGRWMDEDGGAAASRLDVVLMLRGGSAASLSPQEKGVFRAALAQVAPEPGTRKKRKTEDRNHARAEEGVDF